MRVPLSWLREWIELPASEEELAERLSLGGLEVGDIERSGPDLSEVRVGEVVEHGPHPNADRLSLCRVEIGEGAPLAIVCGAPNVAAGQKVAVALAGSVLPDGTRLKRAKIRGVVSQGMICSERELGLGEDHEGILVLEADARVGARLGELMRSGETVFDVELTPNRGDCASLLGVAREVHAHYGATLHLPAIAPSEGGTPASTHIRVEIEDADGCPLYLARVVRGVRVGPSPAWLVNKLESVGLRGINCVVDVTNLVLMEFGQPLHAFDLATLRGGLIRVRSGRSGETLETLDGQRRTLAPGDLLIADAERSVAIAGVMGGSATEVSERTQDVLLESAWFSPSRVRSTARRLALQTEASYRFERGVDPEGVARAIDRAAQLIAELTDGTVATGRVEARGAPLPEPAEIPLDPERVNRLLGTRIPAEEVRALLERLGVTATPGEDGTLLCRAPSHRADLRIPADLVEEVARIWGYERIPTSLPSAELNRGSVPPERELEERARDSLRAAGLTETLTLAFMDRADPDRLGLSPEDERRRGVRVLNPLVEAHSLLRTSLVPSLLGVAQRNLSRQVERVRIFEVSRIFFSRGSETLPEEPVWVAGLITRGEGAELWQPGDAVPLFFELKGIAEQLLHDLGFSIAFRAVAAEPYLHPGAACELVAEGRRVGALGELHPEVAARFEIALPCALFEVGLTRLRGLTPRPAVYRPVSNQPAARRDLAVLLDREVAAGEVLEAIGKVAGPQLVSVAVFDRYEGKGIPPRKVSLGFRLEYRRADRTLTDAEVAKLVERVVQMLSKRFGGEQRQG